MKQLLDYDPLTGTKEWFEYDHITDTFTITVDQDVSKFLDVVKKRRNDESYSQKGIKEEWWHYAAIPNLVIAELRKFREKHPLNGLSIRDMIDEGRR